ncbi:MAG: hypothetical protein AMS27_04800 [Bacteroides sp. SM23_62_1]|nr:MAG: hypothetical protein AMS27_04800 [Bacteroides sp. SM23_62_1]
MGFDPSVILSPIPSSLPPSFSLSPPPSFPPSFPHPKNTFPFHLFTLIPPPLQFIPKYQQDITFFCLTGVNVVNYDGYTRDKIYEVVFY